MIKYLEHPEIDKTKWDECIQNSFNGMPYAYSWYLDIVSPYWDCLVKDDYESVMPLPKAQKFGIPYLYQPILCQQMGVFSTTETKPFSIDEFLHTIPPKFRIIDIAISSKNFVSPLPDWKVSKRANQYLPLNKPYHELYKDYQKNHKKNIQKAIKHKVTMELSDFPFSEFYKIKLECTLEKGVRFNTKDQKKYYQLLRSLETQKKLKIYVAKDENQHVISGICFMFLDNKIFIQSFANETGRKFSAMYLLLDKFIQEHANSAFVIDFMGSSIEGIAYHNLGYGSENTSYDFIQINKLPKLLKIYRR